MTSQDKFDGGFNGEMNIQSPKTQILYERNQMKKISDFRIVSRRKNTFETSVTKQDKYTNKMEVS